MHGAVAQQLGPHGERVADGADPGAHVEPGERVMGVVDLGVDVAHGGTAYAHRAPFHDAIVGLDHGRETLGSVLTPFWSAPHRCEACTADQNGR